MCPVLLTVPVLRNNKECCSSELAAEYKVPKSKGMCNTMKSIPCYISPIYICKKYSFNNAESPRTQAIA
jgi:hypothetical protein